MRFSKRGQIGEGVIMIYRLLIVTVIAGVIFAVSAIYYDYEIDIRDAEARILTREVVDCLAPKGVLNLDEISESERDEVLSYCDFSEVDRFYVGVDVIDSEGVRIAGLQEGDSGALWIKDLYGKAVATGKAILGAEDSEGRVTGKYNPGYYKIEYPVYILNDEVKGEGKIKLEVLVNYE